MHHKDSITLVAKKLPVRDQVSFGRTCRLFNSCIQELLDNEAVKRFVKFAKYGKEQEAQTLLSKVSIRLLEILLTRRVTFKDAGEYRTYVKRTVGQFVLASDDNDFWRMLQPFYQKIPNGRAVMTSQIAEQFPETPQGYVNTYHFAALVNAFDQINTGTEEDIFAAIQFMLPEDHPFTLELSQFRSAIEKSQTTEITTGRATNITAIFAEARNIFNLKHSQWRWFTLDLFSNQVLGFLIRFFNISDAQRLYQGLVKGGAPLVRALHIDYNAGPLFPLDSNANDRLGFHFNLHAYCGGLTTVAPDTMPETNSMMSQLWACFTKQKYLFCRTLVEDALRQKRIEQDTLAKILQLYHQYAMQQDNEYIADSVAFDMDILSKMTSEEISRLRILLPIDEIERIFNATGVIQLRPLDTSTKLLIGCGNGPCTRHQHVQDDTSSHDHSEFITINPSLSMNPSVVGAFGINKCLSMVLPKSHYTELRSEAVTICDSINEFDTSILDCMAPGFQTFNTSHSDDESVAFEHSYFFWNDTDYDEPEFQVSDINTTRKNQM